MNNSIHPAQIALLRYLRQHESGRYSELTKASGLDAELARFHVLKIQKQGLVIKNQRAVYELTPVGKELANNLDESRFSTQKQPKVSVLIVLHRRLEDGKTQYLFQRRMRNPYWGYWGFVSGPVGWGESAEVAASRELLKQTALLADLRPVTMMRKRDFTSSDHILLEDKLFIVCVAKHFDGELTNDWPGGYNAWHSLEEIADKRHFGSESVIIETLAAGEPYINYDESYSVGDY